MVASPSKREKILIYERTSIHPTYKYKNNMQFVGDFWKCL